MAGMLGVWSPMTVAADPEVLLNTIKQVDREGAGHVEAAEAVRELTQADARVLPTILVSFRDANPLAANWIRSAFETIAERELKQGRELPAAALENFLLDKNQDPRSRRMAYEWLAKVDPTVEERLIPGMLHDPSAELRRDAVAHFLTEAGRLNAAGQAEKAAETYKLALSGATDDDQVKAIVEPLKKIGHEIDLQSHFGFLTQWHMTGPFDNTDNVGFDQAYPPEVGDINLAAKYEGREGEVSWTPIATDHDRGIVDIAKQLAPHKGACMYAVTTFTSTGNRDIELRLGTPNAWKVWLNGQLLFGRDEYHRGMALDQYRVEGTLKPGKNTILLKICQNEQTEDWAQRYQFQIRVCDPSGIAVLSADRDQKAGQ
jgi:hypothetical protein